MYHFYSVNINCIYSPTRILFLLLLMGLSVHLSGQNSELDECCQYQRVSKEKYESRFNEFKQDIKDEDDPFFLSHAFLKLAESSYCIDLPLDTTLFFLKKSFEVDSNNICIRLNTAIDIFPRLLKKEVLKNPNFNLDSIYFDYREFFLLNMPDTIKSFYLKKCHERELQKARQKDTTFTIVALKDFEVRDQDKRRVYEGLTNENQQDSLWQIIRNDDIVLRKEFLLFYQLHKKEFTQSLNDNDKRVIALIFLHASPEYVEQNATILEELYRLNNLSMYSAIIDRFFCNKHGSTPLQGIYCKRNLELEKEFSRIFPKYYKEWIQIK